MNTSEGIDVTGSDGADSPAVPVTGILELRMIGGVRAILGGRQLDLGGVLPKTLLASLVLSAGQTLPKDTVVEAMWGLDAPLTADRMIADYMSKLRGVLAPAGPLIRLRSMRPGFRAELDAVGTVVDVHWFRTLLRQADAAATAEDWEQTQALIEQALGWWPAQAVPLADLESPWARNQARVLSGLRLDAVERLARTHLDAGRPRQALKALDGTGLRLDRENLTAIAILARFAAGESSQAVDLARRARNRLATDGRQPGPTLALALDTAFGSRSTGAARPGPGSGKVLQQLAVTPPCPYRHLEPFATDDARWFHGRDAAVELLLDGLAEHRAALLLGPSGSGKTSLIQAGVLPALAGNAIAEGDRWLPLLIRPGGDLLAGLEHVLPGTAADGIAAAARRRLAGEHGYERVLIVVDQFEELLASPGTAEAGLDTAGEAALEQLTLAFSTPSEISVVLVMRDDFYPRLAALAPELLQAAPRPVNVPATLSVTELSDIIVAPARAAGARFEQNLPERIIEDIRAGDREGTRRVPVTLLPPLELALSRLWERCGDGHLTHQAYHDIGGVTGSLANWCNTVFGQLTDRQQLVARRILTALVRTVDDGEQSLAVRRRVPVAALRELATDLPDTAEGEVAQEVEQVVAVLREHRIIATHSSNGSEDDEPQPVVELIHEALIRDWPELRHWIAQDRQFHDWLHRTVERYARWAKHRAPDDLLYGSDLSEGLAWRLQRSIPREIAAFLTASEQRQQAGIRRIRRLNAVLATTLLVVAVAGAFAFQQRSSAVAQRSNAIAQRDQAIAGQILAEADQLRSTDQSMAAQLDATAYHIHSSQDFAARLAADAGNPLSTVLTGHVDRVLSVAFSPDGHTLASASSDATIRLWNVTDPSRPKPLGQPLTSHVGRVVSVAFSPDGHTLASAGDDHTIRLWNVTDPSRPKPLGQPLGEPLTSHVGSFASVAFSPDGHTLASAYDYALRLWNVTDPSQPTSLGQPLIVHPLNDPNSASEKLFLSVAFSPDGHTLASANSDVIRLWNVTNLSQPTLLGQPLTSRTGDSVRSVAFSPDGHTLASAGDGDALWLWDVTDPSQPTSLSQQPLTSQDGSIVSVASSPDGHTVASTGGDGLLRLWNVTNPSQPTPLGQPLTGHTGNIYSVAFSPDGHTLASAGGDNTIRLWTVSPILPGHAFSIVAVAFSPDGHTLASTSGDDTIQLWNVTDPSRPKPLGQPLTGHFGSVNSMAFTPDGHTLASAGTDRTIQLWNVTDPSRPKLLGHLTSSVGFVHSVAFSPDGRTLAGADDGTIRLWNVTDLSQPTPLEPLTGYVGKIDFLALSPDGRTLAGADGTIRLWNITDPSRPTPLGQPLTSDTGFVIWAAFSPDGRTLAGASGNGTIQLWNITDLSRPAPLGQLVTGKTNNIYSVAFSPDGRTLAGTSADGTIWLWNVTNPFSRPLGQPLTSDSHVATVLAFSPDGHTLAGVNSNGTVRLWDSNPESAIRRICSAIHNTLTVEKWQRYIPQLPYNPPCE